MDIKTRCGHYLCLDLNDQVDHYSYHDAQSLFDFYCDLETGHEGMHCVTIDSQKIYWE